VLASYHLGPLTRDETRHYILHRLTMAGWHNTPRWHDAAFAAVFDHSGGIPRRINRLCARVLLYGALEEVGEISGAMVETAGEELTQDLESGGASPNGAGPRPASARELARLGPQPFDAGALFGAGAQAGVTEGRWPICATGWNCWRRGWPSGTGCSSAADLAEQRRAGRLMPPTSRARLRRGVRSATR